MKEANYNNLREDRCPYCNFLLSINKICGRRKCLTAGCFFTMSRETISKILKLPVEVCMTSLKNQTTKSE